MELDPILITTEKFKAVFIKTLTSKMDIPIDEEKLSNVLDLILNLVPIETFSFYPHLLEQINEALDSDFIEQLIEKILEQYLPIIKDIQNKSEEELIELRRAYLLKYKAMIFSVNFPHETKSLKLGKSILGEIKDRMLIAEAPPVLIEEGIKSINNILEIRQSLEESNSQDMKQQKTNDLKKNTPLPQLFKDAKKLDKILEILAHEENRYILKDEEGTYTWQKKKIELVALAIHCLNQRLLNESVQNFSTKVRDSFCSFFHIDIDKSMFQGDNFENANKRYSSDYKILLNSVFSVD